MPRHRKRVLRPRPGRVRWRDMIPVLLLLSTALTSQRHRHEFLCHFHWQELKVPGNKADEPLCPGGQSYGNAKGSPSNCAVDGSGEPWPGPYKWQRTHLPGPTGCTPGIDETQTGIR